ASQRRRDRATDLQPRLRRRLGTPPGPAATFAHRTEGGYRDRPQYGVRMRHPAIVVQNAVIPVEARCETDRHSFLWLNPRPAFAGAALSAGMTPASLYSTPGVGIADRSPAVGG